MRWFKASLKARAARGMAAVLLLVLLMARALSVSAQILNLSASVPSSVFAGSTFTNTITVANNGSPPIGAGNVFLVDSIPQGCSYVSATQISGPLFSMIVEGSQVMFSAPLLIFGATSIFQVVVQVPADFPQGANLSHAVNLNWNTGFSSAQTSSSVSTEADLSFTVSIQGGIPFIVAGAPTNCVITVTNNGPSDAQNVNLTVGCQPPFMLGSPFPPIPNWNVFNSNPQSITLNTFTLAAGQGLQIQVGLSAPASTTPMLGTPLVVALNSATADPFPPNNNTNFFVNVQSVANLSLTETVSEPVVAGSNVTYTLVVSNAGPSDAMFASLSDSLIPGTVAVQSQIQMAGPSFQMGLSASGIDDTIADFPAGQSATFQIVAALPSNLPNNTLVTHTAAMPSVSVPPESPVPVIVTNNTVETIADLAVAINAPSSVFAGQNILYTISVTNNGPSDAQDVALFDSLTAGLTLVSQTQTAGPAFDLGGSGNAIFDFLPTLTNGGAATFQVTAQPPYYLLPNANLMVNTPSVAGFTTDDDSTNNSATASTSLLLPSVSPYVVGTRQNTSLTLSQAALLAQAILPTGDRLAVVLAVSPASTNGGSVSLSGSNIVYDPLSGFTGRDQFTYVAQSAATGNVAAGTVVVAVLPTNSPPFNSIGVTLSNGIILNFLGAPGEFYRIQQSGAVNGPYTNWSPFIRADSSGNVRYTNSTPSPSPLFYRVVLTQPPA